MRSRFSRRRAVRAATFMVGWGRVCRMALVVVCVVAGVLGLGEGSAGAFQTRVYEESFGSDGTSATHFERPASIAVDQLMGGVFVGDPSQGTVLKFNAAHAPEPFTEVLGGTLTGFGNVGLLSQVTVDSSSHNIYFNAGERLQAYGSGGKPANFTAGPGAGTNEISAPEICGVAVDSSGDIYVSEWPTGVRVFAPSGEPLASILVGQVCNLAVDSHGVVYATNAPNPRNSEDSGPVLKFAPTSEPPVTSSTTYASPVTVDATPSFAVAVNPTTNHVLVDEGSRVAEYDETGARLGSFGGGAGVLPGVSPYGAGVAVNAVSGQVFVAQSNYEGQVEVFGAAVTVPDVTTEPPSSIDPKGSATLDGTVKPDGIALTQCQFEYVEATHYEPSAVNPYATGGTVQCESPAAGEIPTTGETQVHARISGLVPGVTYDYRLMASNKTVSDQNPPDYGSNNELSLPPLPAIEGAEATSLTRETAELSVKINPGSLKTTYHFEYDTSPYAPGEPEGRHGESVGGGEIAANAGNTGIGPVEIAKLEHDHTYYWRVVAINDAGTTLGADHTFVYDTSGEVLPDHRAYEMVTPPHKDGALIGDALFGIPFAVSEDGSRFVASSIQCFAGAESCKANRGRPGSPYLFSRTSAGWVTTALAPPASEFVANSGWLANPDTGMALFSMPTPPMFEDDFYVRELDGSFVDIGPGTPPAAGPARLQGEGASKAAASDFSRVVIQGPVGLWVPGVTGGETTLEYSGTGDTAPVPVGVSGGPGSTDLISSCNTALGGINNGTYQGVLSADGETVFFTAGACGSGVPVDEVFARIGEARTVAISEPSAFSQVAPYPGCSTASCVKDVNEKANWSGASFAGASTDGLKAFFTSAQQLTDSATQGSVNLYEYDMGSPLGEGVIDASAGDTSGHGPRVRGVVAISTDGSRVYFVAQGVLSTTANAQGETAQNGMNNLYVFERDTDHPEGHVAFVVQLPEADSEQWTRNGNGGEANVTPGGRFLVFESHGDLTSDATRTDGATQIYRYDAQTGVLVRISIGESGFNDNGNAGVGNAEIVSADRGWLHAGASRSDPTMSHDGSYVFFTSPIGLTPHALNDVWIGGSQSEPRFAVNVYEWHEGRVYLISDGRDTGIYAGFIGGTVVSSAVFLFGSDATGSSVFFSTADALVEGDTDTQLDFYDARICTTRSPCVSSPPPSLPPCLGEACHGTPAAQLGPPSAGTVAFNGQGNVSESSVRTVRAGKAKRKRLVRCSRGKRRVRGRCVKMKAKGGRARKSRSHRGGK
jgi:hypothetical protein